jgi:uncharacterized phage protein (TIGR01671 family)
MRKIKFRAWEKSVRGLDARGMMWQSDETFKDYVVGFDGSVYEKFVDSFAGQSFENYRDVSDRFILMQYTGLKDKNGREIYEGDIVRYKLGGDWIVGDVRYDADSARYVKRAEKAGSSWDYKDLASYASSTQVIGNIYEDPELLEQAA